jgi:hypothetical protein
MGGLARFDLATTLFLRPEHCLDAAICLAGEGARPTQTDYLGMRLACR